MTRERKLIIRDQAGSVIYLLNGFTPEQRELFNNAMKTTEEFAQYILELTNDLYDSDGELKPEDPCDGCHQLGSEYCAQSCTKIIR
jgi:hypothetical protein